MSVGIPPASAVAYSLQAMFSVIIVPYPICSLVTFCNFNTFPQRIQGTFERNKSERQRRLVGWYSVTERRSIWLGRQSRRFKVRKVLQNPQHILYKVKYLCTYVYVSSANLGAPVVPVRSRETAALSRRNTTEIPLIREV